MNSCGPLRLGALIMVAGVALAAAPAAAPAADLQQPLQVETSLHHGPLAPSAVPTLPGLQLNRNPHGGLVGRPAPGQGYQPLDGDSFLCHNGTKVFNYLITSGAWWLQAGEQPCLLMTLRTAAGAYAQPALLPDLGVGGRLRVFVRSNGAGKWLDKFESVDAVLAPGTARWICRDKALGLTVRLAAYPLIDRCGFIAAAEIQSDTPKEAMLTWAFGRVSGDDDVVRLKSNYAEISNPKMKFTLVYAGSERGDARVGRGDQNLLHQTQDAPVMLEKPAAACLLSSEEVKVGVDAPGMARFVCLSGYSGYNKQGVADAFQRLEFRPFADARWVEAMKKKWFDHWIGRGLEPEKGFMDLQQNVGAALTKSVEFWDRQKRRLRIKTPDDRFDVVVNSDSTVARELFEYPGFVHGVNYAKYGKINHGYYGFDAAGLHDETAESLHFISGTQDVKGRQRYFMTTFAISDWHEDMDFYFPEQVWWHWRWTGDREFLRQLWPSARRALEHGLAASDPDGSGLFTGYYEMWNSDNNNPGGYSVLQTALGWSALRAGRDIATLLEDRDYAGKLGGMGLEPVYAHRYQKMLERTEQQYSSRLWNKDVGVWAGSEFNGVNRPRPFTCDENYAIWRGLGDPLRNYMALRFIRENYHRRDLVPNTTIEFVNDWWPIIWSLHYPASGDTCASFHSACATGQTDEFWPAFKSVAETAYVNDGVMWHHTGSRSMELEPLFLNAVVDGLFGIKPWFGENLLALRPSFPSSWNDAEIRHLDVNYEFHRDAQTVSLHVTTPVPRKLRVELPVRREVLAAALNGQPVEYQLQAAVKDCRVVIEAPIACDWRFELKLGHSAPTVTGPLRLLVNRQAAFRVENAAVVKIHDPQEKLCDARIDQGDAAANEVTLFPKQTGKFTVFLELRTGKATWWHPLDLDVRESWSIVERYVPPATAGGPAVASPAVDLKKRNLTLEICNNGTAEIGAPCKITVAGKTFEQPVKIGTELTASIAVSLDGVWDRLTPGTLPVTVECAGATHRAMACNWQLGEHAEAVKNRQLRFDLTPHVNAEMKKLFGPQTQWRTDYTGAQHGVDWRNPPPLRDQHGYVLLNNIMSLYEWGILPEQIQSMTQWEMPELRTVFETPSGIRFQTVPGKILALCCTEPYEQFASAATVKLSQPVRIEKLYLLTANLTKALKSYYPGAEVSVKYADGTAEVHQMIPPYTMPSGVNHICPRAQAIRFGQITHGDPTVDKSCYLSVVDIVMDETKPVVSLDFRCVATETLLGIVGATALEAK